MPKTSTLRRAAQISSDVFSPILLPTYFMVLMLTITPLSALTVSTRVLSTLAIFFFTAVIPMGAILVLKRLGVVSNNAITDRRERFIPLLVAVICYIGAACYLARIHAPLWLLIFFIAASLSAIIALIITQFWKISAHGTGIAGLPGAFAALYVLRIIEAPTAIFWLSATILLAGWIGTSRLILGRHTPGQVYAGYALGFVTEFALTVGVCLLWG